MPASPSAAFTATGEAAVMYFSMSDKRKGSGAAHAEEAAFTCSWRSASLCNDPQLQRQRKGARQPLRHRLRENQHAQQHRLQTQFCSSHRRLQPLPLEHEHLAPQHCFSSKRYGTCVVILAELLCLSYFVNFTAAQLFACPGAWTTAALSGPRSNLAATSLPNKGLAMFAGGNKEGL